MGFADTSALRGRAAMRETSSADTKRTLVFLGGSQLVGGVLLCSGVLWKKRVFVRSDLLREVAISPMASAGATGMTVTGRF